MTYQTLLAINGVLIGGLLLSLYFVLRNRSRAIRAESELKEVRKDLEISEDRVGHYRGQADRAELKLTNAHEEARLAHESSATISDIRTT
ncbi:MAG: hypothetical protein ISN28_08225 [Ectothiorhodospiraceae bacterium AqS1]|nr:hypothetical protein [Ectothiorhodospiraceae bacterium AqS1]